MSDFKSTLISYNSYLTDGLFSKMELPTGIDKDILIDVIMLECGEMCPVWTDPYFMMDMIGTWSKKWANTFERWYKAYTFEYEPLYNYDRYEDVSENTSGESSGRDNSSNTNTRSAFDSNTYQPHDKSDFNGNTTANNSGTFSRNAHLYGNIGVTTSQQMLQSEYDIAGWNIYEHIKDLFMNEFCLMLY